MGEYSSIEIPPLPGVTEWSLDMISPHVLNRGPAAVRSPADRLLSP